MANPEHLAKLKEGVEVWNRWRERNPVMRGNFESLAPIIRFLAGTWRWALPKRALWELKDVDLREANLSGAVLGGANLARTDLRRADLSWACLCAADLRGADLSTANLDSADLTNARVGNTIFANVDLSGVKGLETVSHEGPSSIGIDTIYRSKGKISHDFLSWAGVPIHFIGYMDSLEDMSIEFYSLFISYSTHDQQFAERLHADLQAKSVRCWFAPHKLQGGKKVHEQIDEAIRFHDKLLLILSAASMESEWVRTEIFKAREREIREKRRVLFPIRLCSFEELCDWKLFDGDTGKDLAREIREYFIPDFSNWKDHDAYKLAFDRLLDDLHGKPGPASAQSEVP
ncbi:MAG: toll/interleukin-1 receptor domain-containing protein [Terracidiphilus sp.]|jgi:uncharacterized protein YjbI with pentapeptide repeats